MIRETLYQDEDVHFLCDYIFDRTKVAMHLNITPGAWSAGKFKKYTVSLLTKLYRF